MKQKRILLEEVCECMVDRARERQNFNVWVSDKQKVSSTKRTKTRIKQFSYAHF